MRKTWPDVARRGRGAKVSWHLLEAKTGQEQMFLSQIVIQKVFGKQNKTKFWSFKNKGK